MEPEEFEERYAKKVTDPPTDTDEDADEDDEIAMRQDIFDAMSLLGKVKTLLDYVGNVDLCKTVTKRERATMARISGDVQDYLDSVSSGYEEEA